MKKLLTIAACLGAMVLSMAQVAGATVFTNSYTFGGNSGVVLTGSGSIGWDHVTPADFEVPFDTVNSATLTIKGYEEGTSNNTVFVRGVFQGALNDSWLFATKTFDLDSVFMDWEGGQPLNVKIKYNDLGTQNPLHLFESVFALDYNNNTGTTAPVPEPATLLLVGAGLSGLIFRSRKNRA